MKSKTLTPRKLALLCKEALDDKKATDIVCLNVAEICSFTQVFVIATAQSEPQLRAILGSLRDDLPEKVGRKPNGVDGQPGSLWIVVDFGDVVVHVFHHETRMRYQLEQLWSDAPRLRG